MDIIKYIIKFFTYMFSKLFTKFCRKDSVKDCGCGNWDGTKCICFGGGSCGVFCQQDGDSCKCAN